MAELIYHESYGDVTRKQLAAYRKYNISPSDHDDLVDIFGSANHSEIVDAIIRTVNKHGRYGKDELSRDMDY